MWEPRPGRGRQSRKASEPVVPGGHQSEMRAYKHGAKREDDRARGCIGTRVAPEVTQATRDRFCKLPDEFALQQRWI